MAELTPRETQVWGLLARGLGDDEIAKRMGVKYGTAKFHVDSLRRKKGRHKSRVVLALEYWTVARGVRFDGFGD